MCYINEKSKSKECISTIRASASLSRNTVSNNDRKEENDDDLTPLGMPKNVVVEKRSMDF